MDAAVKESGERHAVPKSISSSASNESTVAIAMLLLRSIAHLKSNALHKNADSIYIIFYWIIASLESMMRIERFACAHHICRSSHSHNSHWVQFVNYSYASWSPMLHCIINDASKMPNLPDDRSRSPACLPIGTDAMNDANESVDQFSVHSSMTPHRLICLSIPFIYLSIHLLRRRCAVMAERQFAPYHYSWLFAFVCCFSLFWLFFPNLDATNLMAVSTVSLIGVAASVRTRDRDYIKRKCKIAVNVTMVVIMLVVGWFLVRFISLANLQKFSSGKLSKARRNVAHFTSGFFFVAFLSFLFRYSIARSHKNHNIYVVCSTHQTDHFRLLLCIWFVAFFLAWNLFFVIPSRRCGQC